MVQTLSIYGVMVLRLMGAWAVLHGLLTALNTPERWSSPAYDIVSTLPPYVWGTMLIIGGAMVLFASYKGPKWRYYILVKNIGLWILAMWFFIIAIGFTIATFEHGNVSWAAGSRDLLIGSICVILTKANEPPAIQRNK